ncbi:exported hypothetical protein [Gammaproteobacteria bacterium]
MFRNIARSCLLLSVFFTAVGMAQTTSSPQRVTPNGFSAKGEEILFQGTRLIGQRNAIEVQTLPVADSNGNIKYYDVGIIFTPNANGSMPTSATVSATPSQGIVLPGKYAAISPSTGVCTVTNIVLANARTESMFSCVSDQGNTFEIAVETGAVNSKHTFWRNLHNSNVSINARSDVRDYSWGVIAGSNATSGDTLSGCGSFRLAVPNIIGAQVVGTQLLLSLFDGYGDFVCQIPLLAAN